jgi:natural product biosynthesis luciferase-like monooxygenase protein
MELSLMFFSSVPADAAGDRYRLLIEAARFADEHGFSAIWTPERHFHAFGGLFPDPAVVSAALAMVTRRLQIRAGSLISPLHDTLRIAESWSVVDNLSGGRAAISFGSGWNIDDFVFSPDAYAERQAVMYRQIEDVRALWGGGEIVRRHSSGREVRVRIQPRPVQAELPVWITSSGNPRTFISAGEIGAHLLTHLIGQDLEDLAGKIRLYREALASRGFDPRGHTVTLMLHTYLDDDAELVRRTVHRPFREYLRSAISLEQMSVLGGGAISGGHKVEPHAIPDHVMEDLLDLTFERYFATASLMGTPDQAAERLRRFEEVGVDEIACLIDFLDDPARILAGLRPLATLREALNPESQDRARTLLVDSFMADLEG